MVLKTFQTKASYDGHLHLLLSFVPRFVAIVGIFADGDSGTRHSGNDRLVYWACWPGCDGDHSAGGVRGGIVWVSVPFLVVHDPGEESRCFDEGSRICRNVLHVDLPQEVVDEATYEAYIKTLGEVDLNDTNSFDEIVGDECATGACPIK